MLTRKSARFWLTTFAVSALATALGTPANAWGPEYDYGQCIINTGRESQSFDCVIDRGGGAGGYYMTIYYNTDQYSRDDSKIGTYMRDMSLHPSPTVFQWADGSRELIRGDHFSAEPNSWTFWTQRGWSISFRATH